MKVVEGLLVISACILKSGVSQDRPTPTVLCLVR